MPVAGLAVFGEDGLGATYVGFAMAYLLARAVNQIGWARAAVHVPVFRPVAADTVTGFLADLSRYLLVGSVVLGLVGVAAL